ncbi:MAG: DUF1800 domain-containing protein [Acidobacteriota bacterium]
MEILKSPEGEGNRSDPLGADWKVIHLLNRLGYGPRPGDIDRVRAMGIEAYIEQQLHPESIEESQLEPRLRPYATLSLSAHEMAQKYPLPRPRQLRRGKGSRRDSGGRSGGNGMDPGMAPQGMDADPRAELRRLRQAQKEIYLDLAEARLIRAVYSSRQLLEVMTDFWFNHFNVFVRKKPISLLATRFEYDVIRPHALGRFEDLLLGVSRSPAMLVYLDNWVSSASQGTIRNRMRNRLRDRHALGGRGSHSYPGKGSGRKGRRQEAMEAFGATPALFKAKGLNENYGRELLELHTVGVEAGYTQKDVIEAAACLTGWTITDPHQGARFQFQPLMHEEGTHRVLGRSFKQKGVEQGEALLRMLAHHPDTARTISTKLVRRFVSDQPPPWLVAAAASTFQASGGDIRQVLKTIFSSPRFFSPLAYRAKIKKPLELVASSIRALKGEIHWAHGLLRWMSQMGEALYLCPQPTGYPDTAADWINTNSLLTRLNFALALASNRIAGVDAKPASGRLFDRMQLPQPDDLQLERTRSLLSRPGVGRPARTGNGRPLVLASAFRLGAPDFQKR